MVMTVMGLGAEFVGLASSQIFYVTGRSGAKGLLREGRAAFFKHPGTALTIDI